MLKTLGNPYPLRLFKLELTTTALRQDPDHAFCTFLLHHA